MTNPTDKFGPPDDDSISLIYRGRVYTVTGHTTTAAGTVDRLIVRDDGPDNVELDGEDIAQLIARYYREKRERMADDVAEAVFTRLVGEGRAIRSIIRDSVLAAWSAAEAEE